MSVLVRFGKHKAFLRAGLWMSASAALEEKLNQETARWMRETGGPPIREIDQERGVAAEMAQRFGGRILLRMRTRSSRSKQVFFDLRQLEFDFTESIVLRRGR